MKELSGFLKTKLKGYISSHKEIYIGDLIDCLGHEITKYSNVDILNYLVDVIYEFFNNNANINENLINRYIKAMLGFLALALKENKINITGTLKDKLLNLNNSYNNFIDENELKENEDISKKLEALEKFIKTEEKNQQEQEENKEQDNKNDEKEVEILSINKQIKELEKKINRDSRTLDNRKEKIGILNKQIKELKTIILKYEEKENVNNEQVVLLKTKIEELENKIENLQKDIEEKEQELLNSNELNKKIKESEEYKTGFYVITNNFIDNQVFELLLSSKLTILEIKKILYTRGFDLTENDILESLSRLKSKYKIESNDITLPRKYGIEEQIVPTNKKLTIDCNKKPYIDILKISDIHIDNKNVDLLEKRLYAYYDLCKKLNINTIINLGDLLDYKYISSEDVKEQHDNNLELLDKIADLMPKGDLYHVILGGNHDRIGLKYGFDPIEYIASKRSDIISLGYDNAILELLNNKKSNYIGLHHRCVPRHQNVEDIRINSFLNSVHDSIKVKNIKENIYFDFCGHLHDCYYNPFLGYGVIPNDGCWNVRYYFDDEGDIKKADITTYTNTENSLIKTMETTYKK